MVHDRAVLMAIVLAPVVGFVSWVYVEMRLVSFMFVPVMLLLMVLEVFVQHATMRVLFLGDVACDFILWMGGLLDVVLHIVFLFVGNTVLHAKSSNLLSTQSLLLLLLGGCGHWHSSDYILTVKLFRTCSQVRSTVKPRLLRNGLHSLMLGSWCSVVFLFIHIGCSALMIVPLGLNVTTSINIYLPVFVLLFFSLGCDIAASINVNCPVSTGSIGKFSDFLRFGFGCWDRFLWIWLRSWSWGRRIWMSNGS